MEVILLERVEKLGHMGDVVRVKDGFARNFLLPQRKAIRSTKENSERFESERGQLEAVNLEQRTEAASVAKKLDGLMVTVIRQAGESGQLYGSVTSRDVAELVTEAGFTVGRGQIRLDQPIKALGLHKLRVALHPEVAATVTVIVAKSEEEAKIQRAGVGEAPEEATADREAALVLADSREAEAEAAEGLVDEEVAERLAREAGTAEPQDKQESEGE